MWIGILTPSLPALALSLTLAGCSGSDPLPATASASASAAATDRFAAVLLFDDHGRPLRAAAALQPADTAARTRNGLYATPAQYAWQELVAGPYTVLIDVDALGSVEAALLVAAQMQDLREADPSPHRQALSFFVRAQRQAEGAAIVNTMADAGFGAVFLLLPPAH